MRLPTGALAILVALAGCKSSSGPSDYAKTVLQAPVAATGSGIDPAAREASMGGPANDGTVAPPSRIIKADGLQLKEIKVDPKNASTRIELLRTMLGQDWLFAGRTMNSDGTSVYKFLRRDVFRVESDPFGLPDLSGAPKDMAPSKKK